MAGLVVIVTSGSLAAKRVLEASDRVLNLSGNLVALAFGLKLGVAGDLAGAG
jgi:hypothetical protein